MMLFWGLVVTMLLLAVCFILVPLLIWRKRSLVDASRSREEVNLGLYRERLSELDEQLQRGDIDAQRYEQLKQEAEAMLLGDVDGVVTPIQPSTNPGLDHAIGLVPVCGSGVADDVFVLGCQ